MTDRIKHYQIKRKIGAGGMATVYEAVDTRSRTPVALKILHPHLADQPTYVARFMREAQMARGVSSPHLVRVLEYGQDQGLYYLAQEFVDGVTVQQFIQQHGSLSVQQALDITYQAALALQEANRHGIVHRDIKPQNIMITPAGSIKVMDFGIARTALMESMTMTGMYMGTPQYSSPEQAGGDAVDIRSDIYSLGVVLYQLLTGAVPFQADTPQALLLRVMRGNPVPVSSLRVDLPQPVSDLVDKMLVRDPAGRVQSPEELIAALQPLLGRRPEDTRAEMATMVAPITARQTATAATPKQRAQRLNGRFYATASGAVVLLVLLALLLSRSLGDRDTPQVDAAVQSATPAAATAGEVTPAMPPSTPRTGATTPPAATGDSALSTTTTEPVASTNTPADSRKEQSASPAVATGTPGATTNATGTATPSATTTATPSATASATPGATIAATPDAAAGQTPRSTATAARTPSATPTPRPPTATPAPAQALAAPALTGPGDGETVIGRVVFDWQPVAGSAGYVVQTRSDRAGQTEWRNWQAGQNTELTIPFSSDPGYFDTPGTVYYWRVAALNSAGQPGSFSPVRRWVYQVEAQPAPTATPNPPTATPNPPTPTPNPPTPTPNPPTPTPTPLDTPTPPPLPPTPTPPPLPPTPTPPPLPNTPTPTPAG